MDADYNATLDEMSNEKRRNFHYRLLIELFSVISLGSLIANILIVFVIARYPKLRHQTTNIILMHLNIVQAIYMAISPITKRFMEEITFLSSNMDFNCILYEMEGVILMGTYFIVVLLVSDWYVKVYSNDKYDKFIRVYKFFLVMIYILMILLGVVIVHTCLWFHIGMFSIVMLLFSTVLMAIFVAVMNIVHLIKWRTVGNRGLNTGLAIANIFVLFWCPCLLAIILTITGFHFPIFNIVALVIGFGSPMSNCVYLYVCDNDFNVFFKKVFKCQCNDYENELLQENSVTYSNTNGVQIQR